MVAVITGTRSTAARSVATVRSIRVSNRSYTMKTKFSKLTPRDTTEAPIYISREQLESACYIPEEYRDRIIIVDFVEEEDDRT